jgi:hypothetical protein
VGGISSTYLSPGAALIIIYISYNVHLCIFVQCHCSNKTDITVQFFPKNFVVKVYDGIFSTILDLPSFAINNFDRPVLYAAE